MLNRRRFLRTVGASLLVAPLLAEAQQAGRTNGTDGLLHALRDLGYIEGRNLVMEFRWAGGKTETGSRRHLTEPFTTEPIFRQSGANI
jgi:hypothetical protein